MGAKSGSDGGGDYINHHLHNLTTEIGEGGGFWTLNVDTLAMSVFLGVFLMFLFWLATRKPTSGVPGKWQAFVEILLEFMDNQVKDIYHGTSRLVTPIAITLFFWILMQNMMKFIPADFFSYAFKAVGIHYWKPVPTADINAAFGMSFTVFFLTIFFAIRGHGVGGFGLSLLTHPFESKNIIFKIVLAPFNLFLNFVEWLSKPLSLGMRLFGNMFGGEIVFLLIWLLASIGFAGVASGAALGLGWMIFHILVVPLQAFIFTMLAVVYFSLAEDNH